VGESILDKILDYAVDAQGFPRSIPSEGSDEDDVKSINSPFNTENEESDSDQDQQPEPNQQPKN